MDEMLFWLWLTSIPGVGSSKISKLFEYFKTPEEIWRATRPELKEVAYISEKDIVGICDKSLDKTREILDNMKRFDISAVIIDDADYPEWLRHIFNPPYLLYVKGELLPDEHALLGIVGSRNASYYGKKVAGQLSYEAAKCGMTIVSGMARGIDTCAHKGALNAGARTIAVLGCGVDIVYPKENLELMNYIVKNGAVISEYPPGASPNSINFPARNRIISGMSFATLVIEAGEKSGSLITADFALEQGRSVFAVPGNIDVLSSKGTNNLIKQGAKLISSIEDIIEEIPEYIIDKLQKHKSNNNFTKTVHDNDKGTISDKGLFGDREIFNNKLGLNSTMILGDIEISTEERQILECLSNIPLHIEELSTRSGLGMQELNSILTLLEMKGIINQLVGRTFVRTM